MKTSAVRIFTLLIFTLALATAYVFAQPGAKPAATPAKPAVKNAFDKGDFKVGFSPITKARTPKKAMPKEEHDALDGMAASLNGMVALPRDVYLNLDTCGEPNAFYNPETSEITMCYEYIAYFEEAFKTIEKNQTKVDDMVSDAFVQIFFHELGHCLIDVWELPATGREEDAVDQLAMILMLDGSPAGQKSAVNASLLWDIASKDDDKENMMFWDEHSFSKTRFYDMICLVYGSNPEKNSFMVSPTRLPRERAERCSEEYNRANRSWMKLLMPYILD
ncbi:MAG: DUF4344 domain-containing metallopeptidase [Pyrinomonadaceae bacterium]